MQYYLNQKVQRIEIKDIDSIVIKGKPVDKVILISSEFCCVWYKGHVLKNRQCIICRENNDNGTVIQKSFFYVATSPVDLLFIVV